MFQTVCIEYVGFILITSRDTLIWTYFFTTMKNFGDSIKIPKIFIKKSPILTTNKYYYSQSVSFCNQLGKITQTIAFLLWTTN